MLKGDLNIAKILGDVSRKRLRNDIMIKFKFDMVDLGWKMNNFEKEKKKFKGAVKEKYR